MKFLEYNFTIHYLVSSISSENQALLHKEKTADFETRQAQIFIIQRQSVKNRHLEGI